MRGWGSCAHGQCCADPIISVFAPMENGHICIYIYAFYTFRLNGNGLLTCEYSRFSYGPCAKPYLNGCGAELRISFRNKTHYGGSILLNCQPTFCYIALNRSRLGRWMGRTLHFSNWKWNKNGNVWMCLQNLLNWTVLRLLMLRTGAKVNFIWLTWTTHFALVSIYIHFYIPDIHCALTIDQKPL